MMPDSSARARMLLLGFQHMFAMFGATVLVPILTGLSVSTTLLFAGLGTLLFHLITGGKVPAFLGSSFAFLGGYAAIAPDARDPANPGVFNVPIPSCCPTPASAWPDSGPCVRHTCGPASRFSASKKVMRFFPPIVTGPIIICHRPEPVLLRHQ